MCATRTTLMTAIHAAAQGALVRRYGPIRPPRSIGIGRNYHPAGTPSMNGCELPVRPFRRRVPARGHRVSCIPRASALELGDDPTQVAAKATIRENSSGSSDAPPTRAPSTSGCAISSSVVPALTEPPYWIRTEPPRPYRTECNRGADRLATVWRRRQWPAAVPIAQIGRSEHHRADLLGLRRTFLPNPGRAPWPRSRPPRARERFAAAHDRVIPYLRIALTFLLTSSSVLATRRAARCARTPRA